jgi:periplasmic protein TonB
MTDDGYRAGQRRWTRGRLAGAAGAAVVQILFAWVLIAGLTVGVSRGISDPLKLFSVTPPPPPPKTVPEPPHASHRKSGKASPANLRARPAEIVAPKVDIPPPPPPVVAAPKAGPGMAPSAGAAPVPGPGTGAGGQGDGNGGGGDGDGDGGTPLELIKGHISDSDYPREAYNAHASGTVYLRFIVGANGRVTNCTVTKSSGNADLDNTTCRLIMERFRYRPTRDRNGKAIPDEVTGFHKWELWRRDEGEEPGGQ